MNNRGFTLVEILTAVIIVAILTVMAMPLYEKTIERSRLAEARTLMNRLQEAKLAAMDNMECGSTYDSSSAKCPKLKHLNVAFATSNLTATTFQTKDFIYSLVSTSYPNGICAKRRGGEYAGTIFAYYGLRPDGGDAVFKCKGTNCESYGLDNTSSLSCTF